MLPSKLFFVFVIFWLKLLYHQVMWRMCWNFKFWGIKYHCSSFGKIFTKDNIFLNYQSCVSSEAHACVVKFVLRYIGICVQVLNLSVKNWILKQKCIHNIDFTKNFIRILKSYFGSKIPNYYILYILSLSSISLITTYLQQQSTSCNCLWQGQQSLMKYIQITRICSWAKSITT